METSPTPPKVGNGDIPEDINDFFVILDDDFGVTL